MYNKNIEKNLEIEVLRAYAILLTVVAHLGYLLPSLNPILSYYWLVGGVDLFFCISGFVIAQTLLKKDIEKKDIISFFIKRITRLWPAALFWAFFILFCSIFFNKSNYFGTFEGNLNLIISSIFQIVNFNLISSEYFHFSQPSLAPALRLYWSLSLEEQFYFIFPFLLYFLGKKKVAVIALLLLCIQIFLYRPWPSPLWFFRTDAISLGILIAYMHNKYSFSLDNFFTNKKILRIISLLLFVLLIVVAKKDIVWFYNGLVVVVSGIMVFLASFNKGYLISSFRIKYFLSILGTRSYSLYLTHMVGIIFTKEFMIRLFEIRPPSNELIFILVFMFFTFIFTEFSFRYIEKPIRNKGRNFASKI